MNKRAYRYHSSRPQIVCDGVVKKPVQYEETNYLKCKGLCIDQPGQKLCSRTEQNRTEQSRTKARTEECTSWSVAAYRGIQMTISSWRENIAMR